MIYRVNVPVRWPLSTGDASRSRRSASVPTVTPTRNSEEAPDRPLSSWTMKPEKVMRRDGAENVDQFGARNVSDVLWSEVETGSDRVLGARVLATDAEVVDAIYDGAQVAAIFPSKDLLPERSFMVTGYAVGRGSITFEAGPSTGRNVTDMGRLDD